MKEAWRPTDLESQWSAIAFEILSLSSQQMGYGEHIGEFAKSVRCRSDDSGEAGNFDRSNTERQKRRPTPSRPNPVDHRWLDFRVEQAYLGESGVFAVEPPIGPNQELRLEA